jgi:hypothetical protein
VTKRFLSILATNTGAESISLVPNHRSPTPEGVFLVFPHGGFPPCRAQASDKGRGCETARKISAIPAVLFPPLHLKDFKAHLKHVDMNLGERVPGGQPDSSDSDLGRMGERRPKQKNKGTETRFFNAPRAKRGGSVRGFAPPAKKSSFLRSKKGSLRSGAGETRQEFFFSAI